MYYYGVFVNSPIGVFLPFLTEKVPLMPAQPMSGVNDRDLHSGPWRSKCPLRSGQIFDEKNGKNGILSFKAAEEPRITVEPTLVIAIEPPIVRSKNVCVI